MLNPGPATAVGLQLILLPECTSVETIKEVTLGADRVTTIPISFTGPGFDPSSLTGATLILVPPPLTVPAATPCQAATAALTATTAQTVTSATTPGGTTAASSAASTSAAAATPQPEAITLTLSRITAVFEAVWLPLIVGVLFAFIVCVVSYVVSRWRTRPKPHAGICERIKAGIPEWIKADIREWIKADIPERIKAGSSWNFKDSYATNVTAIGGLLGAAVAAAGSSSTLLPGVETSRFALLSALWGAVAVAAPLVLSFGTQSSTLPGAHPFDAPQPATSVRFGLLMFCLGITLTATGAELTTLGVLASESATSHAAVYGALMAFALLVGAYVVITTATLVSSQKGTEPPRTALNTFAGTSLMG